MIVLSSWMIQLLAGGALGVLVALAAYRAQALSRSGGLAAAALGFVYFGLGGWRAALLLLAFFISSSILSRLFRRRKLRFDEKFSKGSQRDAGQVLANGGLGALFVLAGLPFSGQAWPWVGLAAALAAVNADTWATELGVLARSAPRLITTGKPVEPGTSGAVSPAGMLAALGGAALIAIPAELASPLALGGGVSAALLRIALISLAGLFGSLADSFLGATLQAIYTCPACRKETERHPLHLCGTPTTRTRGLAWMNNDAVNFLCSLSGAALAVLFTLLVSTLFQPISGGMSMDTFPFSSPAFENGQPIPARFTCSGENRSPELRWSGVPDSARSLALIVDDPDAPVGVFVHWVLYNMDASVTGLPEGLAKTAQIAGAGTQGGNDFRKTGYDGPCPPAGKPHRYFFKLYALDLPPTLPAGLNKAGLLKQIEGHVLAEAQWMGTFQR